MVLRQFYYMGEGARGANVLLKNQLELSGASYTRHYYLSQIYTLAMWVLALIVAVRGVLVSGPSRWHIHIVARYLHLPPACSQHHGEQRAASDDTDCIHAFADWKCLGEVDAAARGLIVASESKYVPCSLRDALIGEASSVPQAALEKFGSPSCFRPPQPSRTTRQSCCCVVVQNRLKLALK